MAITSLKISHMRTISAQPHENKGHVIRNCKDFSQMSSIATLSFMVKPSGLST